MVDDKITIATMFSKGEVNSFRILMLMSLAMRLNTCGCRMLNTIFNWSYIFTNELFVISCIFINYCGMQCTN